MKDSQILVNESYQAISKGSKSFAMASLFFSKRQKKSAWLLYRWCRYCDDQIDQAEDLKTAQHRLSELRSETVKAFQQQSGLSGPFASLSEIAKIHQIPEKYALDLLDGMQMDVQAFQYKTEEDLLRYCYGVAGAVGLMMCPVMNLQHSEALKNAVHMGLAMQLTNISRDIADDLQLGRIYLPESWLKELNLSSESFAQADRRLWALLAFRIVRLADKHYREGEKGLPYLPWRAAWAVLIAAKVYRRIGDKVLARGSKAWDKRCYVSTTEKLWITCKASLQLIAMRIFTKTKKNSTNSTLQIFVFDTKDFM